jgi:type IV pilus assembly protein PilA
MKNTIQKAQAGFTLIELMIVVAIIGILASVAMPAYQKYTQKAKFTEVVSATSAVKLAVELCINSIATATGCTAGSNGIPANVLAADTPATSAVDTVTVADGVITVVPNAINGIVAADTFVLTPAYDAAKPQNGITWVKSGGCTTNASGALC